MQGEGVASSSVKPAAELTPAPAGGTSPGRGALLGAELARRGWHGDAATVSDPSPLAGLTPRQRARRLCGILELAAAYGDTSAAAEALRHYRWEREMREGRPAQKVELDARLGVTVVDTLSAPPGTPIPAPKRIPQRPAGETDAERQGT